MGDAPEIWLGDCHVAGAGDFLGDSSFRLGGADNWLIFSPKGACDGAKLAGGIGPEPENRAFFLNSGKCFSSARSMPSFVNGLGNTSFIPSTS